MDKVTCVFTSCGRFDLLKQTFNSFIKYNDYPIEKYIIIDNSTLENSYEKLKDIVSIVDQDKVDIIVNEVNIGQVSSIDKAYNNVTTDYIFHCEDDWLFYNRDFIEKSLDVLKFDNKISNINIRTRFNGERGSMHPISRDKKITNNKVVFYEYVQNFLGEWHGFSWNPGLRKKSDYDLVKPYIQYVNEQGVGKKYKELGYKSACLEEFYCTHIGGDNTTLKANM
jgi:GT2 family glycosyltransferase